MKTNILIVIFTLAFCGEIIWAMFDTTDLLTQSIMGAIVVIVSGCAVTIISTNNKINRWYSQCAKDLPREKRIKLYHKICDEYNRTLQKNPTQKREAKLDDLRVMKRRLKY